MYLLNVDHRNDVKMFKTFSSEATRLRFVVPLAFRWTAFLWSLKNKKRKLSRTGAGTEAKSVGLYVLFSESAYL